jgi:hypothetical protein
MAMIGSGKPIKKTMLPENIRCLINLLVYSRSSACIGGFFKTVNTDGKGNVASLYTLDGEMIVNKGTVGKDMKNRFPVFQGQFDNIIFANQGFAAGYYIKMNMQLFPFRYIRTNRLNSWSFFMSVFPGPAAFAAQDYMRSVVGV